MRFFNTFFFFVKLSPWTVSSPIFSFLALLSEQWRTCKSIPPSEHDFNNHLHITIFFKEEHFYRVSCRGQITDSTIEFQNALKTFSDIFFLGGGAKTKSNFRNLSISGRLCRTRYMGLMGWVDRTFKLEMLTRCLCSDKSGSHYRRKWWRCLRRYTV